MREPDSPFFTASSKLSLLLFFSFNLGIVGASINSFVNRKGPQHWTVKETERFYEALRQLGTDFGCMEAFFENRTRKQLKRKYQAEQTRNPRLVEMALDPKNQTEIGKWILSYFWDG